MAGPARLLGRGLGKRELVGRVATEVGMRAFGKSLPCPNLPAMSDNLFVGGFPYETTEEELPVLFRTCGTLLTS